MENSKTLFEKIISREIPSEILLENEHAIVIKDINPQAPLHVLIIPKKKIERIEMAHEEDAMLLGNLLLTAKEFALQQHLINGFRLVINNGKDAQETIPHLHIHLLAKMPMKWPPC